MMTNFGFEEVGVFDDDPIIREMENNIENKQMSGKDCEITLEIKEILQSDSIGQNLRIYFDSMPEKNIRRAITLLSNTYPDKTVLPEDEFSFITYMLLNEKIIRQESFFTLVQSISAIEYTENQKDRLVHTLKIKFELLCEKSTFELDNLLIKVFKPCELIAYMEILIKNSSIAVLQHISDILRHDESFFSGYISVKALEALKQEVSKALLKRRNAAL